MFFDASSRDVVFEEKTLALFLSSFSGVSYLSPWVRYQIEAYYPCAFRAGINCSKAEAGIGGIAVEVAGPTAHGSHSETTSRGSPAIEGKWLSHCPT
jgi:hypothetical protein